MSGPTGIALDQTTGTLNDGTPYSDSGTHARKWVDPTNPHLGDAIIATLSGNGYTLVATAPDVNLSVESAAFNIGIGN